jgi:predicted nucleic acid-binding protein
MRIMLDTNVLISAILFRSENLSRLIKKVVEDYTLESTLTKRQGYTLWGLGIMPPRWGDG